MTNTHKTIQIFVNLILFAVLTIAAFGARDSVQAASPAQDAAVAITYTAISAGRDHTCGLTSSGGARCWGNNSFGQLGNGSYAPSNLPVEVSGGFTFSAISAGGTHTCGLTTAGGVKCWGLNFDGQLGDGTTNWSSYVPVDVIGGFTYSAISAGQYHTCGLTTAGGAKCWGRNNYGQLGNGTYTSSNLRVDVSGGFSFSTISAGQNHTCGLLSAAGAMCWGDNSYGQLGKGANIADSNVPVLGSGMMTGSMRFISAGGSHSCGLRDSSIIGNPNYCWGNNWYGQLGDGTKTSSNVPVALSGLSSELSVISAGGYHTCGLAAGVASCWGQNSKGQLGIGTFVDSIVPALVNGGLVFSTISSGYEHTCGITSAGKAVCWGNNQYGQLGDGTKMDSNFPVIVLNLPGTFNKSTPPNGAKVTASPTLAWGASTGASSYEYCYYTANENACTTWVSTGTTLGASLSGLTQGVTYYWQVRARDADGVTYADGNASWYFTVTATNNLLDTVGVFRPTNGAIYLKKTNATGFADAQLNYGVGGDYPVMGDWNGDGVTTLGIYRDGAFYLRNSNTIGYADLVIYFGMPGDQPVAGDWNGDGIDTIGTYQNGTFMLRNSNTSGAPDMIFGLGMPGDVGIVGDWTNQGFDTTGVFRPSNGALYLKYANTTGFADVQINYGLGGDKPVTGDWDGDGIDTIGVFRGGMFLLRNSNTIGFADWVFGLGVPGDMPIAGKWGLP